MWIKSLRVGKYVTAGVVSSISLFYIMVFFCRAILNILAERYLTSFSVLFFLWCVWTYSAGVSLIVTYLLSRYKKGVRQIEPKQDTSTEGGMFCGHLYSLEGKTYLDSSFAIFEISSADEIEIKHGEGFTPASAQDMHAPKTQKLYARLNVKRES